MPGAVMKSKKIMAILLALAVLAFLPPGQACAAVKHYTDAERGFSFSYPETWEQRVFAVDSVMVLSPPIDGVIDGISAYFCVHAFPPFEAAEMTEEAIAKDYKKIKNDVEILSYKKTKFRGVPCVAVDMVYTRAGKKQFREQMYLANRNGKGYALMFSAMRKDYGKYEGSFKIILDSFKF